MNEHSESSKQASAAPSTRSGSGSSESLENDRRNAPDPTDLNLSSTVRGLSTNDDPVSASSLTGTLFSLHPEYVQPTDADTLIGQLREYDGSPKDTALGWVSKVRPLLKSNVMLDGRLLAIGLAILDPFVLSSLRKARVFESLMEKIEHSESPPQAFSNRLTSAGKRAFGFLSLDEDPSQTMSDIASGDDLLFRQPFALGLALRIRALRRRYSMLPFMMHLDGPWGSGKTTVLGFVERMLTEPDSQQYPERWIVVRYNAWQNQRSENPWWTLADSALVQCRIAAQQRQKAWLSGTLLGLRHFWFRHISGRMAVIVASIVALAIGLALFKSVTVTKIDFEEYEALFAIVATLFGAAFAIFRFWTASDEYAQSYLNSRHDPMRALENHLRASFVTLRIPVAIIVDDIDRCEAIQVVRLLEGVQVLFATSPIVFLFAGDRKWINTSFEKVYSDFLKNVQDSGKTLGSHFLEKTFQLSVWLPDFTQKAKENYWANLLNMPHAVMPPRTLANEKDYSSARTEGEVLEEQREDEAESISSVMAYRQSAIRRLAAPDIERNVETHVLYPLRDLVESNPRAMKRLVMAYGMARVADLLAGRQTSAELLARWTILQMRSPDLAQWLLAKPERIRMRSTGEAVLPLDEAFVQALRSAEVGRILDGLASPLKAIGESEIRGMLQTG